MDLVSFIPNIGPTALFSPGSHTTPPFLANHTGTTDGTGPSTASSNVAELYNRLLLQVASVIVKSGLAVDNQNWAQLSDAVSKIAVDAANGALGSGVVTTTQYNNDFHGSTGFSGYYYLKGIILQWGVTTPSSVIGSFFTTTFPVTFPHSCMQVLGSVQNMANTSYTLFETDSRLDSYNASSATWFQAYVGDNGPAAGQYSPIHWLAVGY